MCDMLYNNFQNVHIDRLIWHTVSEKFNANTWWRKNTIYMHDAWCHCLQHTVDNSNISVADADNNAIRDDIGN